MFVWEHRTSAAALHHKTILYCTFLAQVKIKLRFEIEFLLVVNCFQTSVSTIWSSPFLTSSWIYTAFFWVVIMLLAWHNLMMLPRLISNQAIWWLHSLLQADDMGPSLFDILRSCWIQILSVLFTKWDVYKWKQVDIITL